MLYVCIDVRDPWALGENQFGTQSGAERSRAVIKVSAVADQRLAASITVHRDAHAHSGVTQAGVQRGGRGGRVPSSEHRQHCTAHRRMKTQVMVQPEHKDEN